MRTKSHSNILFSSHEFIQTYSIVQPVRYSIKEKRGKNMLLNFVGNNILDCNKIF